MAFRITIEPSGHGFEASPEQSILQSALDAGFNLPYGCRDGACGSCKGKVLAGRIDHGTYQASALSEDERRAGHALFCCGKPLSDLTIECREVAALTDVPIRTLPCRVHKMERAAPDVMIVYLRLPANERLQFLPGQYLDILLKEGRRRSFSLANAPHADELLELHLRLTPGGRFTEHVFGTMKERDILRFEGPLGSFFLREDSTKPIVFVAGGTGFAPMKAMIEHALHIKSTRPMVLYWGARRREDLYLNTLPERWARDHAHFEYIPVLSEAAVADEWRGRAGLVHRAVMDDLPDLSYHQAYVCGAPAMVDAARRDFTAPCKLPAQEFFADSFTYAAEAEPGT